MIEKSTHNRCPSCPNTTENDRIYHCQNGHLFCTRCAGGISGAPRCPECDYCVFDGYHIGTISPPVIAPIDLREWEDYPRLEECPRCKCNVQETQIYRCYENHKFCEACKKVNSGHNTLCPLELCRSSAIQDYPMYGLIVLES